MTTVPPPSVSDYAAPLVFVACMVTVLARLAFWLLRGREERRGKRAIRRGKVYLERLK